MLKLLLIAVVIGLSLLSFTIFNDAYADGKIPAWVKKIFNWYGQGQISEDELLNAIKFLVQNGIIQIDQNSKTPQSNPNTSTTTNPSSNNIITNSDFPKVDANIDAYKDYWARFSGQIINIDTENGATALTLDLSPLDFGKEVFVILNNGNPNSYVKDDCIIVEGKIYGKDEGQNAFGAFLSYPRINGEKINKLSCLDAQYPALKTVTVNTSQKAGNVVITINKVEFAEKHTRVSITIQNLNTDRKVSFYSINSYIVQGQSQYSYTSSFGTGIKDIDTSILPGIIETGYIFYDPAPVNSFKLLLEANEEILTDDFQNPNFSNDQLDHKFTFDIPIQS